MRAGSLGTIAAHAEWASTIEKLVRCGLLPFVQNTSAPSRRRAPSEHNGLATHGGTRLWARNCMIAPLSQLDMFDGVELSEDRLPYCAGAARFPDSSIGRVKTRTEECGAIRIWRIRRYPCRKTGQADSRWESTRRSTEEVEPEKCYIFSIRPHLSRLREVGGMNRKRKNLNTVALGRLDGRIANFTKSPANAAAAQIDSAKPRTASIAR
jgi:hypothetical protein